MKAEIKQLKEDKEVYNKYIKKRDKRIKNLLSDCEKLQDEKKESQIRIGMLFSYEQKYFEMIDTPNYERKKVSDRDNLINQLIEKVSELGGNSE